MNDDFPEDVLAQGITHGIRPVSVNPEWGARNLEFALDHMDGIPSMYSVYRPVEVVRKKDAGRIARALRKRIRRRKNGGPH